MPFLVGFGSYKRGFALTRLETCNQNFRFEVNIIFKTCNCNKNFFFLHLGIFIYVYENDKCSLKSRAILIQRMFLKKHGSSLMKEHFQF